jgi:eukaryotic-like serine/threonine-protein kinase
MTRSDVFRAGDVLDGYRLLEDFRVVGAGLSEWSFAERDGRTFFIKRFLSPTYPEADAPGSERIKAKKRARCAAFEAHHRGIQAAMAPLTTYGGNLIATLDFFRIGAKYYKVTEKVDVAGLQARDIAGLDFAAQLVLLKTVAHSLKILHDLRIVHSDLKPGNVLVKRTELGYTTKLIDFDSSYIAGNPPPPEEIVGTMNYYSPELVRYIQGAAAPGELTEASDIFALGLIYAEYLTGAMPPFDPAYHEPAVAVLHGQPLKLGASRAPTPVTDLVERMLQPDPAARPSVAQVHSTLMNLRGGAAPPTAARAPVPIRPPVVPRDSATTAATTSSRTPGTRRVSGGAPSVLRGKGVRIAGGTTATGAPVPTASAPSAPSAPHASAPPHPTTTDRASERPGGRGRALLGRLLGKLDERRAR